MISPEENALFNDMNTDDLARANLIATLLAWLGAIVKFPTEQISQVIEAEKISKLAIPEREFAIDILERLVKVKPAIDKAFKGTHIEEEA